MASPLPNVLNAVVKSRGGHPEAALKYVLGLVDNLPLFFYLLNLAVAFLSKINQNMTGVCICILEEKHIRSGILHLILHIAIKRMSFIIK